MTGTYTRAERAELEAALKQKRELKCPSCGGQMTQQPVLPSPEVSYVRHRVWILCVSCRRSVSLDTSSSSSS